MIRAWRGGPVSDIKTNDAVLSAVRARQQFWIEERERARAAHDDQAAGDAQRLIHEYDAFIAIVKRSEYGLIGFRKARR